MQLDRQRITESAQSWRPTRMSRCNVPRANWKSIDWCARQALKVKAVRSTPPRKTQGKCEWQKSGAIRIGVNRY